VDHVTIATSSGLLWLFLVSHFSAGLIGLLSGTIALAVAKGGRLHKKSGIVFTFAMIASGVLASTIAVYEGKVPMIIAGMFVVYLIFTATTTVKPLSWAGRPPEIALMLFAFSFAAFEYYNGSRVWQLPGHAFQGVPAGMMFFLGTISLFAAVGDLRIIRTGSLRGPKRLARHLWRMCFGLFIATGSFFLGQAKFIPEPIRFMPLLGALAVAPLVILLYWMWRVRLRRRLTGLIIGSADTARVTVL
jgi:hypothetical protein